MRTVAHCMPFGPGGLAGVLAGASVLFVFFFVGKTKLLTTTDSYLASALRAHFA